MRKIILIAMFLTGMIIINSCEKEDEGRNITNISSYGRQNSHNMGRNCMDCHKSGGSGAGWFNLAGTVYDSLQQSIYPNCTVKLYTEWGGAGTLKYTIQVDAKGNFYTTDSIILGTGLYPVVIGATTTKMMGSAITTGQCSSCHGVSTDKLWTK